MALTITGVDANGRVTPKGTNVIIPMQSAGIGDIVFCKSGGDPHDPSNLLVVGRGTSSASVATLNSLTYYRYGTIYGFVNGFAMIVADRADVGKAWTSLSSSQLGPEYGWGKILLRNGKGSDHVYAAMNLQRTYDLNGNYDGSDLHPGHAWTGGLMSYSTFSGSTGAAARALYGEGLAGYKNYLTQVMRVNGAPGTCFGAVAANVKVHEFGRYMMSLAVAAGISNYPAFKECYDYTVSGTGDAAGNWWLPSMFEMGELMIDAHLNLVNEGLINDVDFASYRWSCVRYDSGVAWFYYYAGMSAHAGFGYEFAVRPVTLLKLV